MRNHKTPEGAEIGVKIAKFCDEAEPVARLKVPELLPRCNSCALRAGPHLANASPYTQMDLLKCLIEGHEFYCHEPAREGHLCSGWAMMMLAKTDDKFCDVPWDFLQAPEQTKGGGA